MKKKGFLWSLLAIVMGAAMSVGLSSCGDDDPDPELTVSPLDITIDANGGSKSVTVTAKETDWTVEVTRGDDWLTANKNGNQASLRASKNEGTEKREGSVRITATANGSLTFMVSVTQDGATGSILIDGTSSSANRTFEGNFGGNSGIVFKQSLQIVSNVQWNAQVSYETTGQTNWLSISPTTGKGTVTMDIYPISENETSANREATITLSGEGINNTIKVIQKGGKPVCYVEPANTVALYDRIAWEYKTTGNVNKFHWILLEEREFNRLTDRELTAELNTTAELKFQDNYLSVAGYDSHDNRITSSTTYYMVTLAYDADDKSGELRKIKITTPDFKGVNDDAWVTFDNLYYISNWGGFGFETIKKGYCDKYHLIYGLYTEQVNPAVFAFEINYYLKNRKKHWLAENWGWEIVTNYPNNDSFIYYSSSLPSDLRPYASYIPWCFGYAWGIFQNGTISSDILGFQVDLTDYNYSRMKVRRNAESKVENVIIRQSVERERAKALIGK
ncbi:MAG: BACON domain-containing protein [Prevotella sp.]|nr:BACON domain-containing protein [Prevotella sp.]